MNSMNFVQRILAGKVWDLEAGLEQMTAYWHEQPVTHASQTLHDFLGFTWVEWSLLAHDPTAIHDIIDLKQKVETAQRRQSPDPLEVISNRLRQMLRTPGMYCQEWTEFEAVVWTLLGLYQELQDLSDMSVKDALNETVSQASDWLKVGGMGSAGPSIAGLLYHNSLPSAPSFLRHSAYVPFLGLYEKWIKKIIWDFAPVAETA